MGAFGPPQNQGENVTVSIVMSAYNRAHLLNSTLETIRTQTRRPDQIVVVEDGDDGGKTESVCLRHKDLGLPIDFYRRHNRPDRAFSNPAIVRNIGIKRATGDILIIQEPEVKYTAPTDIEKLVAPVEQISCLSMFAPCRALKEDGSEGIWYGDPATPRFTESCHAVRRAHVMAIGGYDENFIGYGREDDDFLWRLNFFGVHYRWAKDVLVIHQWHAGYPGATDREDDEYNYVYGGIRIQECYWLDKGFESNVGKNWGDINS